MQNNEIAIIGGAGFVGTRLAMRLDLAAMPYKVCDIEAVSSGKNYIHLDVENTKSLESIGGAKAIINLAAVHRDDVRPLTRYYDVNVQGALNVCNAARREGINKIIFTLLFI